MSSDKPETDVASRTASRKTAWTRWRTARRAMQVFFLLFFVYLVLGARGVPDVAGWKLAGTIPPEVVFLADPLTWVSASIASRSIIVRSAWLILLFAVLTLILGRVFCGWVCPLGTLIDLSGRILRRRPGPIPARIPGQKQETTPRRRPVFSSRTKYYILSAVAAMALLGVNVAGWVDPLAILVRGTTFAVAPATEWTLQAGIERMLSSPMLVRAAYPASQWLRDHVFSPIQQAYSQGFLHLGILVVILALSRVRRRYWCSVLCPLGALYGLLGRLSPMRRHVSGTRCNDCQTCGAACRMQAINRDDVAATDPSECVRCLECQTECDRAAVSWRGNPPAAAPRGDTAPLDLTRRGLLGAIATGVVAVPLLRLWPLGDAGKDSAGVPLGMDRHLLRPPGARAEKDFLRLCIRCGGCFKVCPQNAIHPALLESGPEGLWTPTVRPRLGYCEPACTLCTVTCPTTALRPLTEVTKRTQGRLGIAVIDRPPCLPWGLGVECGVCEELCPVYPKAIVFRPATVTDRNRKSVELRAPVVIPDKCTGCGICENKCPVEGESAIRVERKAG